MILLFAPKFDSATEYSFDWAVLFLENVIEGGLDHKELLEKSATKKNFDKYILNSDVFVFFDHGINDGLISQNRIKFVNSRTADTFKDKKVFAMACLSAEDLGKRAYYEGCDEYWGATESIGFVPADAHLFGEVYVRGASQRFIEELPIEEVWENMRTHFDEQKVKTDNPWSKIWFEKDKNMWVCWHDGNTPDKPQPVSWWRKLIEWILDIIGINYISERACQFGELL